MSEADQPFGGQDSTIVTTVADGVSYGKRRLGIYLADPLVHDARIRLASVDGTYRIPTSNPAVSDFLQNLIPPGTIGIHMSGERTMGTGTEDIWDASATTQPEPDTGGYDLYVKSSHTDDDGDPVGNGIRTMDIHYLDTAGVEQNIADIVLNGTTEVNTGVTDCMFVQSMDAETVGSATVAVGDVEALAGSGGSVVAHISAGGNQTLSTMYQVPVGKLLTVSGWHGFAVATTTKIVTLRIRVSSEDDVLNAGVYHFQDSMKLKDSGSGHIPIRFIVPALATIKVTGVSTGAIGVSARWSGWLSDV